MNAIRATDTPPTELPGGVRRAARLLQTKARRFARSAAAVRRSTGADDYRPERLFHRDTLHLAIFPDVLLCRLEREVTQAANP